MATAGRARFRALVGHPIVRVNHLRSVRIAKKRHAEDPVQVAKSVEAIRIWEQAPKWVLGLRECGLFDLVHEFYRRPGARSAPVRLSTK